MVTECASCWPSTAPVTHCIPGCVKISIPVTTRGYRYELNNRVSQDTDPHELYGATGCSAILNTSKIMTSSVASLLRFDNIRIVRI